MPLCIAGPHVWGEDLAQESPASIEPRFAYETLVSQTAGGRSGFDGVGDIRTSWLPEGELALAQALIYLGTSPKSNAAYKAFGAATRTAEEKGSLMLPKHIPAAPTKLMSESAMAMDMPMITTRRRYSPDRTISQKKCVAKHFIRPSIAALSVKSGSVWNIGPGSVRSGHGMVVNLLRLP